MVQGIRVKGLEFLGFRGILLLEFRRVPLIFRVRIGFCKRFLKGALKGWVL